MTFRTRRFQSPAIFGAAAGGGGDAAQTTAFLTRADAITTVGATERAAYKALINGLVAASYSGGGTLFSAFDALYIFATDTQAHALLNLIQNAYNATLVNTVAFAADTGFTASSGANSVTTNFNPTVATTPKYLQNSAHFSVWSNTSGVDSQQLFGNDGSANYTHIYPAFSGPATYMRINDGTASGAISSTPTGQGFYLASRTSSTNRDGYWNDSGNANPGLTIGNVNSTTSTTPSNNFFIFDLVPGGPGTSLKQYTMGSIGGALNSTDVSNFYNLVRAYMTAVGVP